MIKRVNKSRQVWWSKTGKFDHQKLSDSNWESLILGIGESMSTATGESGDTHGRPETTQLSWETNWRGHLVNSPASACIYGILMYFVMMARPR